MPSIRLIQSTGLNTTVGIACLFAPVPGSDDDVALARAVTVALNTDRLALPDDVLPDSRDDNRRGWWGDLDAKKIWNGWPIGTRLWLMVRDKITDRNAKQGATIERARRYIREALRPFVDAKIASGFDIALEISGTSTIRGTITIYRGPKRAISLEYQDLWSTFGG